LAPLLSEVPPESFSGSVGTTAPSLVRVDRDVPVKPQVAFGCRIPGETCRSFAATTNQLITVDGIIAESTHRPGYRIRIIGWHEDRVVAGDLSRRSAIAGDNSGTARHRFHYR
jgi:hypothetical protein